MGTTPARHDASHRRGDRAGAIADRSPYVSLVVRLTFLDFFLPALAWPTTLSLTGRLSPIFTVCSWILTFFLPFFLKRTTLRPTSCRPLKTRKVTFAFLLTLALTFRRVAVASRRIL